MKKIAIYTEYITLGQFLKFSGKIRNGGEAKSFLFNNLVKVNGEKEDRRGRKLYAGDQISLLNEEFIIASDVSTR